MSDRKQGRKPSQAAGKSKKGMKDQNRRIDPDTDRMAGDMRRDDDQRSAGMQRGNDRMGAGMKADGQQGRNAVRGKAEEAQEHLQHR